MHICFCSFYKKVYMLRNKLESLSVMKIGKISKFLFFIMLFSFLYFLSLAYFDIHIPLLFQIYLLFFEGILIFICTAIVIGRNRSYKS